MVVDTSALFAILAHEPERAPFEDLIDKKDTVCSAVSYAELGIVAAHRFGRDVRSRIDAMLTSLGIEVVAVDVEQAVGAVAAHLSFGKGVHGARLNICDCFSYALAKGRDESLLFKGDDFAKTDVRPAWVPK